jgi:methylenetetrahydrofolate reductase (NADPH)
MRITEKLASACAAKEVFFSFEVFPPSTPEGMEALCGRLDALARHEPLFVDVTWSHGMDSLAPALQIASHAKKVCCTTVRYGATCVCSQVCFVTVACRALRSLLA